MKLKKTTNDTIDSNIELLSNKRFDHSEFERIKKLYYEDRPSDKSLANTIAQERIRVLLDYTNEIIHSYELRLAWEYDENGDVVDGQMTIANLYQPPIINDQMYVFVTTYEQIPINHEILNVLQNKEILNIHPDEELYDAELIPILFLGCHEDIEENLETSLIKGHHDWLALMN